MYGKAATEDPFLNSSNNRIIESVDVLKIIENERLKNSVITTTPIVPKISTAVVTKPTMNGDLGNHVEKKSNSSSVIVNGLKSSSTTIKAHQSELVTEAEPQTNDDPLLNQRLTDNISRKKQIETRLPNGKRRIKPLFLRNDTTEESNDILEPDLKRQKLEQLPANSLALSTTTTTTTTTTTNNVFASNEILPAKAINSSFREPFLIPQSPTVAADKTIAQQQSIMVGFKLNDLKCKPVPEDETIQANIKNPEITQRNSNNFNCLTSTHKITVKNEFQSLPSNIMQGSLSKVEIYKIEPDKIVFDVYFGSAVIVVAGNQTYLTVACQDQHVYVYSINQSELTFPPIYLEDQVAFLVMSEIKPTLCIAVTQSGLMHMWDLKNNEAIFNRVSLRTFITNSVNLNSCQITDFGYPVIFLSDHRVYIFNIKLKCWQLLASSKDPIHRFGYSQVTQKLAPATASFLSSRWKPDDNKGLLKYQQALRNQSTSQNFARSLDQLPSGVTRCFLEAQLASCSLLKSTEDYKYWLCILVKHLLDKGPENRLRIILDDLLNSCVPSSSSNRITESILNQKKRHLLDDVLQAIGGHLAWQQLYNEYKQQVDQFVSKS